MWFMTRASSPWPLKGMMWRGLTSGTWKIMATQASTAQPALVGWSWAFPRAFRVPGEQQGSTDEVPPLCLRRETPRTPLEPKSSGKFVGIIKFWGCGQGPWAAQQELVLCRNRAGPPNPNKVQDGWQWAEGSRTTIWAEFYHFLLKLLRFWASPFHLLPLHKELCWRKVSCGKVIHSAVPY